MEKKDKNMRQKEPQTGSRDFLLQLFLFQAQSLEHCFREGEGGSHSGGLFQRHMHQADEIRGVLVPHLFEKFDVPCL